MAKVALLIGVSEYEEGLAPLPSAVKDIEELQRVLQHPEMGGFDEVKTLANPEAHTMQFQIETLFDGRSKDDLVLFFFSGHGIKDDAGKLYFASRYTRKNVKGELVRSTAVPTSFVHEIMNNSRAKRQAIILDCCFSGAFDPSLQSKDDGSVDLQTQLGAEGRVVLTSSSSTQYSFSPTEQQGSDLSIYTRYLVEGIETGAGDINSDGFVSMLELHEYAAGKVRETAPKMTPKIIVLKDKGFEIILSKARVTDPKLRYRKAASKYANAGVIRPAGRAVLNTLRQQLGITIEDATEIENEVLRPYQERLANLQQYREALIASAEHEYPLNQLDREDLDMLQQMLGLGDEDVLLIQQEVEAQFVYQSAVYQQNLAQYELALTEAIEREFPFSQQDLQGLESLRQSLGLRNEDVTIIKQPLIQQAESRYQEKLRQQSELRRQEQEKVEYASKLQRYEQEFIKAIQAEYPLNQFAIDELKAFQDQFRLRYEDINQIEQKIREPLERKYQEKLKQQELEKQKATYTLNLQRYEREFNQAVQSSNPLGSEALNYWKNFQQSLNLKDEDVEKITKPILDQADVKYQDLLRKQAEERLKKQEENYKVEYASKLQRYEQEFIKAIQAEYPLSQFVIDALSNLQTQLGLKNEDVTRVEKPFRETAEVKHQENLSQKKENDQVLERLKELEEELLKAEQVKAERMHQERLMNEASLKEENKRQQRERDKPNPEEKLKIKDEYRLASGTGYSFCSALEIDYRRLRTFLSQENWQEADQETLNLLILIQGKDNSLFKAFNNNPLNEFDWVKSPLQDLRTLDRLWRHYSNDHFGLTVQREIGYRVMNRLADNKNSYDIGKFMTEFGSEVGWYVNGQWISPTKALYQSNAPKGHLPSSFRDGFANVICGFGHDLLTLLWRQLNKIQESDFLVLFSAEEYNIRGVEKYNREDYHGAILDFTLAINNDERLFKDKAYRNRANAKINLGDKKGGIEDLRKALESHKKYCGQTKEYNEMLEQIKRLEAGIFGKFKLF